MLRKWGEKMAKTNKQSEDTLASVINLWNDTWNTITDIVENKKKERYAEAVLLISSLLEEQLKQLIGFKIMYTKLYPKFDSNDRNKINEHFLSDSLSLYQRIKIAAILDLIDNETYKNLELFRKKRNKWIHNFYMKGIRPNPEDMFKTALKIFPIIIKKMNYYLKKLWG